MHRQHRWQRPLAILAIAGLLAACGSDSPVGPEFGDLEFAPPGPIVLGSLRDTSVTLSNTGSVDMGPILLGKVFSVGRPPLEPDVFCNFETNIVPASIASLSPGASVNIDVGIDDSGVDVQNCFSGDYDIRIQASVNGTSFGAVTLRVAWETP